ncbi:RNA polymerase sigma-70 factor, ECF subfamily [Pedococcus cremeus]|uniref:RNA polymerase sigma-70 factor, ECF subfamily n=1 Tax=Pedococcus cremeus TaxID=587636 RepID=A0A1H9VJL4_9MICO|nr:RNA polymerase sigma-70 factor [Pedococcus cremeus]SES21393.1 RNA polymerase sigma-70 factor, ECF subfamily [Pedococcus cremeus]
MTSREVDDAPGRTLDAAAEVFNDSRPRLFGVAYRMLGSVAEAEDIVQEAWLRWQQTDRSLVGNPAGFLTTVTTRLALNVLDTARARREQYVGPWLPEPVDTSADPTLGAETAEALDAAVLVLMEKLGPEHRAAYVLREAFCYPYDEIAEILDTTAPNARQLVSRAKKHVQSSRSEPVDPAEHRALLDAFVAAARDGDLARLEQVLSAEVVSTSDGAGIAPRAARRPVVGRDKVARFVAGWADWWTGTSLTWLETNGRPSVLVTRGDSALALLTISSSGSGIDQLLWVMAPAKLAPIAG